MTHRIVLTPLAAVWLLVIGATTLVAQDREPISYVVDLTDARNHSVIVEMKVPVEDAETELMMAVWTPGSYLVREYARHLDSMTAANTNGEPVNFEKVRKNRWRFQTEGLSHLLVRYRLYCSEMSVRTNWVGRRFAMLNGAPTFLTLAGELDRPHEIRLRLPEGWTRSATSLQASGNGAHRYRASDFDELVDSPIVAGQIEIFPFKVADVPHQFVLVNDRGMWDGQKVVRDLERIVEAHHQLWGTVPYDRYLFINVLGESGGGLEHDNSCLMLSSRWTFRNSGSYRRWLSLASHEFFHAWNVRRLRPRTLVEYDYENEVYTRSLWVAEGITSYYEDLLLVRAGLMSGSEFLRGVSRGIGSVQGTPGRLQQSLANSSYDAWIKYYRAGDDENSRNTQISYYTKGAVAALLLDVEIRKRTDNRKSLDDVLRLLYERHLDSGFTPDDFRRIAGEVAGADLSDWFARAIDSTEELEYGALTEVFGLGFPESREGETGAEEANEWATEFQRSFEGNERRSRRTGQAWTGFRASGDGRVTVQSVEADSPATEAGIHIGDEIIALDGFRISGDPSRQLQSYEPGERLEWLIARRGELMTIPMTLGERVSRSWNLVEVDEATDEQRDARRAWLSAASTTTEPDSDEPNWEEPEAPEKAAEEDSAEGDGGGDGSRSDSQTRGA